MACGTGKTNTALLISERLQAKRVLILVPSLGLVKQFLSEWRQHRAVDFDYRLVCSDQTVDSNKYDPAIQRVSDLGVPVVTTEIGDIRTFLGSRARINKVVVSTYQSSEQIANAQRSKKIPPFDLVICDEAHRTAAATESYFSLVLDDKKIRSKRRLFMTATPKYISGEIKEKAEELGYNIISMDDESVYGPQFHRLNFSEAIRLGELADYRLVALGVTTSQAKILVEQARIVTTKGAGKTDTYSLAKTLGLIKTINKYKLRKIISFHRTIDRAKQFVGGRNDYHLSIVNDALPSRSRVSQHLWTKHINGEMAAGVRDTTLQGLKALRKTSVGLISNVACLGEGIDVPELDSVAFIDPKNSETDIIQAVGRAIRNPRKSKKISTIYVPIVIKEGDSEIEIFKTKEFKSVLKIVWALRSHDDDLAEVLDKLRINLKNDPKSRRTRLPKKLVFNLPKKIGISQFHQKITTKVIRVSANLWDAHYSQLLAYGEIYGDYNVPRESDPPFDLLGEWVHRVRYEYRHRRLSKKRIQQLNAIRFRWFFDGQTLTKAQSDQMLSADTVAERLGYRTSESLHLMLHNGEIKPDGYDMGPGEGGLQVFFKRKRVPELKRQLGITILKTKTMLNAHEVRKKYGLTAIYKYQKRGEIKAAGRGVSGSRIGWLYHEKDVKRLVAQTQKGITLRSTSGLMTGKEFETHVGITGIDRLKTAGKIEPHGFAYARTRKEVVAYYHPSQKRTLLRALGVTRFNTNGLYVETEASEYVGLDIGRARRDEEITPTAWVFNEADEKRNQYTLPAYSKSKLDKYKKLKGITLDSVENFLSKNELLQATGVSFTTLQKKIDEGLVKIAGKGVKDNEVRTYFECSEVTKIKEMVSIRGRHKDRKLTLTTIIDLMVTHFETNGDWPKPGSGKIPDNPGETWSALNNSLNAGGRGLKKKGRTLAKIRPQAIRQAKAKGLL